MLIKSFTTFEFKDNSVVSEDEIITTWLEKSLLNKILEISSWNNNSADRPQILKYKDYFGISQIQTPQNFSRFIYTNLSNNPEVKECILLMAALKVKGDSYSKYESLNNFAEKCPEQQLVTQFTGISHQLPRIMELELQVQINNKFMKEVLDIKLRKLSSNNFGFIKWAIDFRKINLNLCDVTLRNYDYNADKAVNGKPILNFLKIIDQESAELELLLKEYFQITVNSIHCLHQIINILNTYGLNHFLNHTYLAGMHEKLGDWLKHLHLCKMLEHELGLNLEMDTIFNRLLGFRVIKTMDVIPQYQLALQYYYEASQVHSEGAAYKFMISNFIYLEDDYFDNLGHFGAAMERQRINSGDIRGRINNLIEETKSAGILEYDNLVNSKIFDE